MRFRVLLKRGFGCGLVLIIVIALLYGGIDADGGEGASEMKAANGVMVRSATNRRSDENGMDDQIGDSEVDSLYERKERKRRAEGSANAETEKVASSERIVADAKAMIEAEERKDAEIDEIDEQDKEAVERLEAKEGIDFYSQSSTDCNGTGYTNGEPGRNSSSGVRVLHQMMNLVFIKEELHVEDGKWTMKLQTSIDDSNSSDFLVALSDPFIQLHMELSAVDALALKCGDNIEAKKNATANVDALEQYLRTRGLIWTTEIYDDGRLPTITNVRTKKVKDNDDLSFDFLNDDETGCTMSPRSSVDESVPVPVITIRKAQVVDEMKNLTIEDGSWDLFVTLSFDGEGHPCAVSDTLVKEFIGLSAEEANTVRCGNDSTAKEEAKGKLTAFRNFLWNEGFWFTIEEFSADVGSFPVIIDVRNKQGKKPIRKDSDSRKQCPIPSRRKRATTVETEGSLSDKEAYMIYVHEDMECILDWEMRIVLVFDGRAQICDIADSVIESHMGISGEEAFNAQCNKDQEVLRKIQHYNRTFYSFIERPDNVWTIQTTSQYPLVTRIRDQEEWMRDQKSSAARNKDACELDIPFSGNEDFGDNNIEMMNDNIPGDDFGDGIANVGEEEEEGDGDESTDDEIDVVESDQVSTGFMRLIMMHKINALADDIRIYANDGQKTQVQIDFFKRVYEILQRILPAIKNSRQIALRDLFYRLNELGLCRTSQLASTAVNWIATKLNVQRADLNIRVYEKGRISGNIAFTVQDSSMSCQIVPLPIYEQFLAAPVSAPTVKVIAVVESDAYLKKLETYGIPRDYPELAVLTGRGHPDLYTRQILARLTEELKLPALAFTDMDNGGDSIYITYKFGSANVPPLDNAIAKTPNLKHVFSPDLVKKRGLKTVTMSEAELKRANHVLEKARSFNDEDLVNKISERIRSEQKCSIVNLPASAFLEEINAIVPLTRKPSGQVSQSSLMDEDSSTSSLPPLVIDKDPRVRYFEPQDVWNSAKYNPDYAALAKKFRNGPKGRTSLWDSRFCLKVFNGPMLTDEERAQWADKANELNAASGAKQPLHPEEYRRFYCLEIHEHVKRLMGDNPSWTFQERERARTRALHDCRREFASLPAAEKASWISRAIEYAKTTPPNQRKYTHAKNYDERFEVYYCLEEKEAYIRIAKDSSLSQSQIFAFCYSEYNSLPTLVQRRWKKEAEEFFSTNLATVNQAEGYYKWRKPNRERLQLANPNLKSRAITTLLGKEFTALSRRDRLRWYEKAEACSSKDE